MNQNWALAVLAAPLILTGCGNVHDAVAPTDVAAAPQTPRATGTTPRATKPASPEDTRAAAPAVPETLNFNAQTVDGAPFSGSSLVGHAAVLWFWAPGCSDCQRLAPGVVATMRANPGVSFIGIAGLADAGDMRKAAESMHIDAFTQLADLHGALWRRFGITSQPAFAFLDRGGTASVHKGGLREAELARRTAALG